jgi:hypothetical protein
MKYDLEFYTDYSQFFICDTEFTGKTDSDTFWTDEAYEARLAIEDGILGVGIGKSFGTIKVEVNIIEFQSENFIIENYDHIVEGNVTMRSGTLQVLDCPNSSIEFQVPIPPGRYRVRVYSSNLHTINEERGDDFYKVEIWPDAELGRKVIKTLRG